VQVEVRERQGRARVRARARADMYTTQSSWAGLCNECSKQYSTSLPGTSPLPYCAVLLRWVELGSCTVRLGCAGRTYVCLYIQTYIQCILPRLALSPRPCPIRCAHLCPRPRRMRNAGCWAAFACTPYNTIQATYPTPLYHVVYLLLMLLLLLLRRQRQYQTGIWIRNRA
jgi:hypothetical protein